MYRQDVFERSAQDALVENITLDAPLRERSNDGTDKSGLKILLVEDDDADSYIILAALNNIDGVESVIRARDGVEALEIVDARQYLPDLALVDLSMPRKDGHSLLRELKARILADFPAVVLTSSRADMDVYRASKFGAWKYLTKKESIPNMTRALKRVIRTI